MSVEPISMDIFNESLEFIKNLEPDTYEKVKYLLSIDKNILYDMGYAVRHACEQHRYHVVCKIEKKHGRCIEQLFCVSYYSRDDCYLIALKEYNIFGERIQKCYILDCIDSFVGIIPTNKFFIKLLNYFNINSINFDLSKPEHEMLVNLLDKKNIEVNDFIKLCKDNDIDELTEESLFYLKLILEK